MEERRAGLYDAVVFDLDGTLLDTLADLTYSTNAVLQIYGMPQYAEAQIKDFVGNGIRRLLQQAVPEGEENPQFEHILQEFRVHYDRHCMDQTEPYPGIISLLDGLRQVGCKTAIVSNKADFAVKKLRDIYFRDLVPVAIGEREGCRRKPAPDSVLQALEELGVSPNRAVYVGDSDVDLRTAENAGIPCIAVSWGFRSREFLLAHGAEESAIAANVMELKHLLGR